jgi:hypothetical protein
VLAKSDSGGLPESQINTLPVGVSLKMLYPGETVESAMKLELKKAQKAASSINASNPLESALFFEDSNPDRMALIASRVSKGSFSENDVREILNWNRRFRELSYLLPDSNSPLFKRVPGPIEETIANNGGDEAVLKIYVNRSAEYRKEDEAQISTCRMVFYINSSLFPNKNQSIALRRDVARAKELAIETIKGKFPSETHQSLEKSVRDLGFILPPTREEFESSIVEHLRNVANSERRQREAFEKMSPGDVRAIVASISDMPKSDSGAQKRKSDDQNKFCGAFMETPMSDGNFTALGDVELSFTTATGEEASRMKTLLHEIGHSVDKGIADNPEYNAKFAGVRKCLSDQHTELERIASSSFENEALSYNIYIAEDFADAIAGVSGKKLDGKNSWCQMLELTDDRKQYVESTMHAVPGDPHSAAMFRVLNFELMRVGKLTDHCESYLKEVKFNKNFHNCLDLAKPDPSKIEESKQVDE